MADGIKMRQQSQHQQFDDSDNNNNNNNNNNNSTMIQERQLDRLACVSPENNGTRSSAMATTTMMPRKAKFVIVPAATHAVTPIATAKAMRSYKTPQKNVTPVSNSIGSGIMTPCLTSQTHIRHCEYLPITPNTTRDIS